MIRSATQTPEASCSPPPPRTQVRDLLLTVLAALFLVPWIGAASGQTAATNVSVTIEWNDGWTYRAGIDGGAVAGFLATRDPASVPMHTFPTIWFERQADGSFSWDGVSSDQTVFAAAKAVEARAGARLFNQPDLRQVLDDSAVSTPTADLIRMVNGVAVGDIFQAIVPILTPLQVEVVVDFAARGAVTLTSQNVRQAQPCEPREEVPGPGGQNITTGGPSLPSNLDLILARSAEVVEALIASEPNQPSPLMLFGCAGPPCVATTTTYLPPRISGCDGGSSSDGTTCVYNCSTYVPTFTQTYDRCNNTYGPITYTTPAGPNTTHQGPANPNGTCPRYP